VVRAALWPPIRGCTRLLVAACMLLGICGCDASHLAQVSLPPDLAAAAPRGMPALYSPGPGGFAAPLAAADIEPNAPLPESPAGSTETLTKALSSAYLINPALNAERARLRATDEQVAVAKSGLRPTVNGFGDTSYANTHDDVAGGSNIGQQNFGPNGDIISDGVTHPRGYSVQLSQPIFEGFQNLNAIRQAKASVQAGRETLRVTEQTTLLAAVTAYVDVVRDQAIVRLRETNVSVLTELLTQTRGQFTVSEVTRTDVAQVEARLSSGIAFLSAAQADLKGSRAVYEQVIGHPPGKLVSPPSLVNPLPTSLDDAMTAADGENPAILSSVYQEEASLYAVSRIMGELLPTVSLEAQYEHRFDLSKVFEAEEVTTVTGRVKVPFYQGGGVAARVRQAKEINIQLKRQVEDARLRAHSDVVANWGILQSAPQEIASAKAAVEANRIALDGMRQEQKVGQRTTLDILDTQRDLMESEIGLVVALRDRVVAEYALAAAVGRLDAQSLGLSVPNYDPIEHYDTVKNKWAGLRPPAPPDADE
jgi:outer membrane protein